MLKTLLNKWIWSGVDLTETGDITPIKLTNTIALVASLVLFLQLPAAIGLLENQGMIKLLSIGVIIILLTLVPVLNGHMLPDLARALLIIGYLTYIFTSTIAWQQNLNHHYFLLLGVFVCPFLFFQHEEFQVWHCVGTFALLFLCIDIYWHFSVISPKQWLSFESIISTSNALFFVVATLLCSFQIRRNINLGRARLHKIHNQTQHLLSNTLPAHVIPRLATSPHTIQEVHPCVTVLFADFAGYSQLCQEHSGEQLVEQLNTLYCAFDGLCEKYGLLKIKTNGDEYMAVAGIHQVKQNCALDCCHFATELLRVHQQFRKQFVLPLQLRVGIATGDVIAGVIGKQSLAYDLWGDTVNLASRLENASPPDRIQVCHNSYLLAKQQIRFIRRGEIKLKGIGTLVSYLIDD